jgi:hypothetical protein
VAGISEIRQIKQITVRTVYKHIKIKFFMKRRFIILLAGAVFALAIANVPTAAGQETAVIKTGRIERVSVQEAQLRADEEEELPDSIIVYSPTGEKITKYVYLPGESYGRYTWENGAWKFVSAYASTSIYYLGRYDREYYNAQTKVSYEIRDGRLYFYIPIGVPGYRSYAYPEPADTDFSVNYDANGNLTSFRILYDGYWEEFTVTYNATNNPVSVERRDSYGNFFFKARYEYNDSGYCVLFDSYKWDYEREVWISDYKTISEYDAQDKPLYREIYEDGKMSYKVRFEYYDENYFSSIINTYYDDEGSSSTNRYEWKYDTDGKTEACYHYENDEFSEYAILYYPDPSGNIPISAGSNVWSSGGQLYIAATTNGAAQIYAVSGQLLKTVALTAGQTTATPLPRGLYIVATGGKTWKVIL